MPFEYCRHFVTTDVRYRRRFMLYVLATERLHDSQLKRTRRRRVKLARDDKDSQNDDLMVRC